VRFLVAVLALATLAFATPPAVAADAQPFVVGEWAGDCGGDFRIGYQRGADGGLVAYTVTKGVATAFGRPVLHDLDASSFTLDFNDGVPPILWKRVDDTIRPWSQGQGDAIMFKDGMRDGIPTPTFHRCR
jgi:hypothetical protein